MLQFLQHVKKHAEFVQVNNFSGREAYIGEIFGNKKFNKLKVLPLCVVITHFYVKMVEFVKIQLPHHQIYSDILVIAKKVIQEIIVN